MEQLLHRTADESTYYAPQPGISLLCTTTNNYCMGELFSPSPSLFLFFFLPPPFFGVTLYIWVCVSVYTRVNSSDRVLIGCSIYQVMYHMCSYIYTVLQVLEYWRSPTKGRLTAQPSPPPPSAGGGGRGGGLLSGLGDICFLKVGYDDVTMWVVFCRALSVFL